MIDKRAILDTASEFGLNPHVIEKDYVLGWVLWGIYGHDKLAENWLFKGGTCLKKCFFETYRFSEDLDFTLTDSSHVDTTFLQTVFAEIGKHIYEESGIELPTDFQKFEVYTNPRGLTSCQGRIGYQGPISPRGKNMPRIKLDLTADERVVLAPVRVPVFHPYKDSPAGGIVVQSYAYVEAFAEKMRALAERTRPRDLYDVINLFWNAEARPAASVLLDVLRQKCDFKGIGLPDLSTLEQHRSDLKGVWGTMLAHQLPALPPFDQFWHALQECFSWLVGGVAPPIPAAYRGVIGEELMRERALPLTISGVVRSSLEIIRFAASNRLCVELEYQGSTRLIEPYSLRRSQEGNVILHAHNVDKDEHRSYRVDRIQGARVTGKTFTPRFEIELTPTGPVVIAQTATREPAGSVLSPRSHVRLGHSRRPPTSRSFNSLSGPTYVYECSVCGKRFNRRKQTSALKPHKDKDGYPCFGRYAHWIDTRY